MNTLRNNVQLIGRLGIDPEIREIKQGRKMARFSLATNNSYKNKAGEWVTNTTWHRVVAWGSSAESVENRLNKGVEIVLEGRLVNNDYVDKNGQKQHSTEVELHNFIFVKSDNVKSDKKDA